jgi:hypothetical protein
MTKNKNGEIALWHSGVEAGSLSSQTSGAILCSKKLI